MRIRPLLFGLPLAALLAAGCSGAREQAGPSPAEAAVDDAAGRPEVAEGERIEGYDLNGDESPDVFHHYVPGPEDQERLVRKDMDINWDGRLDIWRYYDEEERVTKEAFDLDFDGRIDVVAFYDAGGELVRKESDLNFDGQPDLWKFYEKGKPVRKELDTNGNGRVDRYEYFENDEIDRIGEDLDGDGTVDRWTKRKAS